MVYLIEFQEILGSLTCFDVKGGRSLPLVQVGPGDKIGGFSARATQGTFMPAASGRRTVG